MVGLSDLSDTDDSAIEEIISQAQDACVLEQLSAINCSSFSHSVLPPDLDSRFRKLKSFPANHTTPPPYDPKARTFSTLNSTSPHNPIKGIQQSLNLSPSKHNNPIKNPDSKGLSSPSEKELKPNPKPKPKHGSLSPSASSHTSEESSLSSLFMPTQKHEGKLSKQKSLSPNPSPPRKWGCFWCSPKKEKKKSKENILGWEFTSDELLSGLGSLSMKQQQKVIKKALKEEEKISREAEKIVEWAKHASARMNVSDIEDELSIVFFKWTTLTGRALGAYFPWILEWRHGSLKTHCIQVKYRN